MAVGFRDFAGSVIHKDIRKSRAKTVMIGSDPGLVLGENVGIASDGSPACPRGVSNGCF
ncbi:MAG TPA: hypothetical protein VMF91_17000 [Bryobacteraceae bacterium]|nr:hypothetical protein [Bryobacteraceae bacterium]